MTFLRTALSIAALTTATLAASAWAANDGQHDSHHPAAAGAVQIAQAAPGNPAMGTGGMGGMPMMPPGMHGGAAAAGGKDEKADTKRVTVPVVRNGAPVQGRITSTPPTPVVTKSTDDKKIMTRRIVVPGVGKNHDD